MSYEAQHNAIRTRLDTEWADRTPVSYPNVPFEPPKSDSPWIRLTILDSPSFQASMGAEQNIYRHPGIITVNIFTPLNRGDKQALVLADAVSAIFRSWRDPVTRIRFKDPDLARIGPDDKWYHVAVSVPFERDTAF